MEKALVLKLVVNTRTIPNVGDLVYINKLDSLTLVKPILALVHQVDSTKCLFYTSYNKTVGIDYNDVTYVIPYGISPDERIEVGDWFIDFDNIKNDGHLSLARTSTDLTFVNHRTKNIFKIGLWSQQMGLEFLYSIIKGKIKDGEYFKVKYYNVMPQINGMRSDGKIFDEISLDPSLNTLSVPELENGKAIITLFNEDNTEAYVSPSLPVQNCSNCAYFIKINKDIVYSKDNEPYAIECNNLVHPILDCILNGFSCHSNKKAFR